ncbi:LytTR family transcriptional regulator DNA-binding domain-containing protein [Paenibacillus melissococcoides]|uniref:LytTR family transcriptional regulator DNA-binding domain-containing protein n=1 Tax=Paenibacillus melissococcoides TaxID=2912268 RepID=A0ABM9FY79_9BACL|nr:MULTISPECIES: LytTR family DNA-binding domain-containing protein [Paenibacillus]MEB9893710.1 LytTR family DNA-binding domain-containing protein [Bacillus cereus]CAH8244145.1 LytTR family transcriptional regulator DNA-binding domain-containing protein [Paenibacillus melissococcoides]CAH8703778.1 LytTR family transcriptional regulator DNA-binding domain-containing protein [Paenibacillus melissococcoides]CAH8706323.1 LytTR family transcriptional regulator DNA-binding domain-containing protein [
MKISIEEINILEEEEIIIRCHEVNEEILSLVRRIKVKTKMLMGFHEDAIHQITLSDVYYFESVDNKVFMYCRDKVFESKQKLYELEQLCEGRKFFRASKSSIINIAKISYIKPSLSGRFEARMDNGETVMVSRQYVPILKTMLGL